MTMLQATPPVWQLHGHPQASTDQCDHGPWPSLCQSSLKLHMNSMKLVIPLHLLYWSIHTKDESKRGTAFAFIFGVN